MRDSQHDPIDRQVGAPFADLGSTHTSLIMINKTGWNSLAVLVVLGVVSFVWLSRSERDGADGSPRIAGATAGDEPLANAGIASPAKPVSAVSSPVAAKPAAAREDERSPLNPLKIRGLAVFPLEPLLALRQLKLGETFTIEALGRKLSGTMELNNPPDQEGSWAVGARIDGTDGSVLMIEKNTRGLRGSLSNASGSVAYSIKGAGDGDAVEVKHCRITNLVCGTAVGIGLPGTHALAPREAREAARVPTGAGGSGMAGVAPTAETLALESRPGSPNVLYLDFNGETVTGTGWNTSSHADGVINAEASSLNTNAAIRYIWRAVSDDYSAFEVNVTTSRAVYNAIASSHKMMVIFTNYSAGWTGGNAGVAFLNSFGSTADYCCWAFTKPGDADISGMDGMYWFAGTASHESGHTFDLSHDRVAGDMSDTPDYYKGHAGSAVYASWRPIMGRGIRNLTTWDKGDFAGSLNNEDDLTKIAGHLGNVPDPKPGVTPLPHTNGSVRLNGRFGFADGTNRPKASEEYSFHTAGGRVQLHMQPRPLVVDEETTSVELEQQSDLDLRLEVRDSSNAVVFSDNGAGKRDAKMDQVLPPGDYTARILTTDAPEPTFYSTYGQFGHYSIDGDVPQSSNIAVSPVSVTASATIGQVAAAQSVAVTGYSITNSTFAVADNASWLTVTPANGGAITNGSGQFNVSFQSAALPLGTHTAHVTVTSPQAANTVILPVTLTITAPVNNNLITIPTTHDIASPYPSTLVIPAMTGVITRVQAKLNGFTHSYPSDVQMLLVSPTGKKVMLFDQNGGSTGANNSDLTFTDSGISLASPLASNAYKPSGSVGTAMPAPAPGTPYASAMSEFIGDSPVGTWSLYVNDLHSNDGGSIASWTLHIETAPGTAQQTTPIAYGATWNYKDNGSDQGSAWRQPGVSETWSSGAGLLGFGNVGAATTLSSGGITYYFRKRINIATVSEIRSLDLSVRFDDGAVVYVNGTEVGRTSTMSGGAVGYLTESDDSDGTRTETFSVPASLLVEGENLIAVEVHNLSAASSDIAFDLQASMLRIHNAANVAPAFVANPTTRSAAIANIAYTGTLVGSASDADAGDTFTFAKVSGPAWLTIAANGTLGGTPMDADAGANSSSIRVTDSGGLTATATLNISVATALPIVTVTPTGTPGESGAVGQFVFTRDKTAGTLTVPFTVSGTATSGTDYTALPASVTFANGAATATLTFTPANDALADANETITLFLNADAGYTLGTPFSATHTIVDNDGAQTAIAYGATWNYKDDGSNQGTAWRQPGVNENWNAGPAKLGYSNVGGEPTVLTAGRVTYYFRKRVNIANINELNGVSFNVQFDDGAVVYLNGTEVGRTSTMPAGAVTHLTTSNDSNGFITESLNAAANLLVEGENIIGVEVHNLSAGSSDIGFDLQMTVNRTSTGNGANVAPAFTTNPISKPTATASVVYSGQTLAGNATDANAGDVLTFSRVSGPVWLSVAANGALSGTPANSNVGANSFTVRVTDSGGLTADATLNITVQSAFAAWQTTQFPGGGVGSLASGDPDLDGIPNLMEYALGRNPGQSSGQDGAATLGYGVVQGGSVWIHLDLPEPAMSDVTYTIQGTTDLVTGTWGNLARKVGPGAWTWLAAGNSHITQGAVTSGRRPIEVGMPDAATGQPRYFLRLEVTTP